MFQSRHSWLWRAQPASRREAFSQDTFFFFFFSSLFCSELVHLFKSSQRSPTSRTDPSGFAPAFPCWGMDTHPPTCRQMQAASVFPSSFSPHCSHPPSL